MDPKKPVSPSAPGPEKTKSSSGKKRSKRKKNVQQSPGSSAPPPGVSSKNKSEGLHRRTPSPTQPSLHSMSPERPEMASGKTKDRSKSVVRVQDSPGGGAAGGSDDTDQREEGQHSEGQTTGQGHRPSPRDADAAGGSQVSGAREGLSLKTLRQENITTTRTVPHPRQSFSNLYSEVFPDFNILWSST